MQIIKVNIISLDFENHCTWKRLCDRLVKITGFFTLNVYEFCLKKKARHIFKIQDEPYSVVLYT